MAELGGALVCGALAGLPSVPMTLALNIEHIKACMK